ncbi:hypothetical protein [Nonomuraea sp. NPDC049709]|uniref:hypothetical protein n=1 Tax=Nonomuraea sp. NPDC049709 TaxID=3154736 RepID=UPI003437F8E8
MPHGDDLDQRFNELVAQIDADQQRKMRAAAKKGARQAPKAVSRHPREARPARAPRRIGRAWLAMAGITSVIAAAGVVITLRPDLLAAAGPVPEETMPVAAAPLPPESSTAAASLPPEASAATGPVPEETQPVATAPDAAKPFEGSKAEDWAEGAAGFDMPEAKAVGGLSKKDVAKGIERTRKLLTAALLDRKTILGGKPAAFMELLPPEERSWFRKGLTRKGDQTTRGWVTSIAPKTAELASDVIKVHGRTKLSSFKQDGRTGAKLETNYIVVYAIQRPGQAETLTRLVKHERGSVLVYREGGEVVVWIQDGGGSVTPARCDVEDGYIHPFYDDSVPDKVGAEGTPTDPYELDEPELKGECGASKGT